MYKQIGDNPIWLEKPFSRGQAWIDLLLMANFTDGHMLHRGTIVEIQRGQVFRSIKYLSDRWGWNRKKTMRFLALLEAENMVKTEGTPNGTCITIEKYAFYQDVGTAKGTTDGTSRGQQKNKEINNNKENIKRKSSKGGFEPPTVEEVTAYCNDRNNSIDPHSFIDYYAQQGWKLSNGNRMKDWKAAVRLWERRRKDSDPPQRKPRPSRTQEEMAAEVAAINGMTLEEWQRINGHAE